MIEKTLLSRMIFRLFVLLFVLGILPQQLADDGYRCASHWEVTMTSGDLKGLDQVVGDVFVKAERQDLWHGCQRLGEAYSGAGGGFGNEVDSQGAFKMTGEAGGLTCNSI